jgi:hypothetical protein
MKYLIAMICASLVIMLRRWSTRYGRHTMAPQIPLIWEVQRDWLPYDKPTYLRCRQVEPGHASARH